MNKDSNFYTFLFSLLMVLVVASSLALTSESLKEKQNENVVKEKMQNIISTIGVKASRDEAQNLYKKYIKSELSLLRDGSVDVNKDAFLIDLSTEVKKDINLLAIPYFQFAFIWSNNIKVKGTCIICIGDYLLFIPKNY